MTSPLQTVQELYDREVLGRILDAVMRDTMPLRHELLADVSGRVAEIGFGSGANLSAYPRSVSTLVAIEPSHGLLERARDDIVRSGLRVELLEASASRPLPLDAHSFDAVVITFVLCSVKRVPEMLQEARRLLRPNAPLLVVEHVQAPSPRTAFVQRAVRPLWSRLLGGCNPSFDARAALESAGFDTSAMRDVKLPFPYPVSTGLLGTASLRGP